MHGRTWQAAHGRRPRLFVGYIPDQEGRESNQGPKDSVAQADIQPADCHDETRDGLTQTFVLGLGGRGVGPGAGAVGLRAYGHIM